MTKGENRIDGLGLVSAGAKQGREMSESVQERRESGTRLMRFLNLWSMRPFVSLSLFLYVSFSLCLSLSILSLCFCISSFFHLMVFPCLPDEANLA